jgi:acyl carrier protein
MPDATELEERVIAAVMKERGEERENVELSCTLVRDLGMDGDDAVEFFEKFGERFSVDLTDLWEHWDSHFGPEVSAPSGFGVFVVIGAGVAFGGLVHEMISSVPAWAATICLTIAFWFLYAKVFGDVIPAEEKAPITVQDLVDAAACGKWDRVYEESPKLFRNIS